MAVSGRKISDYGRSGSKGSAEKFEHSCVPCLSEGQHLQARGFCVECQEYLCLTCLQCHKKTKASRHHQLIDIDKIDQDVSRCKTSEVCTEICSTHRSEVIKFFCLKHEELGCHDCMTLRHRTCRLDYIPDKCVGISDSSEYLDTLTNLDLKLKEADAIIKRGENMNKEIDIWYDNAIKDVENVRKEIDDHLDKIEEKFKEEAKHRRHTDKQEVNTVLESYTKFTSDMKKLKLNLKDLNKRNKNSDIFIAMKRAKSKLQSEVIQDETVLDKNTKLLFECNKDLESILSIDYFGKLTEQTTNVTTNPNIQISPTKPITPPSMKNPFSSLSHKGDMKTVTNSDRETCDVNGCAVLSPDKLILADWNNNKLKVVNTLTGTVVEEKQLDSYPYDVTVLPEDQIAVTMPDKREIKIMRTTGHLSTSRSIKVPRECRGITYNNDRLFVVCGNPNCVLILDIKGRVMNTIPLQDESVFSYPNYIEVSKDNKILYISDYSSKCVASVTFKGEVMTVKKDMSGPRGLVMLDDGSLLVCGFNIYRLQADLKQSCKIGSSSQGSRSICFSPEKREVFVGGFCNYLTVFRLQ